MRVGISLLQYGYNIHVFKFKLKVYFVLLILFLLIDPVYCAAYESFSVLFVFDFIDVESWPLILSMENI